ncbi:MAG TPA: hypothetical protein VFI02_21530 [Armatimonadota bacterium]|nr:hypothetical protein [Armatimonadota bacterium]
MVAEESPDVFPELLKQLADGLSIHTRIAARYWLALALVSGLTVMPIPDGGSITLPFLSKVATTQEFYPFAFMLISLLAIGYSSASSQGIRTRELAQRLIDNTKDKYLYPFDIHIQDVFDAVVSPSINRMAPLVQILQGKQQFLTRDSVAQRSRILVFYFGILRFVAILVVNIFPGYALITAFAKSSMFRLCPVWGIPVCLFWTVGIVAISVLSQSLCSDIDYFLKSVRRIQGTAEH